MASCIYKTDTTYADEISVEDITISFVCKNYPRKLIHIYRKYEVFRYRNMKKESIT